MDRQLLLFVADEYDDRTCMYCKTEQEAKSFCKHLDGLGKRWRSGERYTNKNHYSYYESEGGTVYYFNQGTYGSRKDAYINQDTVLNYDEFIWDVEQAIADTSPLLTFDQLFDQQITI